MDQIICDVCRKKVCQSKGMTRSQILFRNEKRYVIGFLMRMRQDGLERDLDVCNDCLLKILDTASPPVISVKSGA